MLAIFRQMQTPQEPRPQSGDPVDSIIVVPKEEVSSQDHQDLYTAGTPPPASRPAVVIMESRRDVPDRDEYEVEASPKPRPQFPLPNWNAHRESNGARPKSPEVANSRKFILPQETTSGEASRGRKRKIMSDEDKERANLVRRLGACPNCRKRKLACSPSHERPDADPVLKVAVESYRKKVHRPDLPSRPAPVSSSAEFDPDFVSDSTATSVYEEPIPRHVAQSHRASTRAAEPIVQARVRSMAFETDPSVLDAETRNRHEKLKKFGQSLDQAAKANIPVTSPSIYTSVHVLLLRWQDDDLGVADDAEKLAEVFSDLYHFEVTTGLIPSDSPSRWLSRKLLNFVELEDDSRQTLKIVWYGGHSFISDSNQTMWSNDCQFNSSVSFQGSQSLLEEARSDVLILLDACGAGNGSTSHSNGATEVITAGGWSGGALPDVGADSFTSTLTTELRLLSSRVSFTVEQLYQHMLARIKSQLSVPEDGKRRHPTPFHFMSKRERGSMQSIVLCPLQDASVRENIGLLNGVRSRAMADPSPDVKRAGINLFLGLGDEFDVQALSTDYFVEWLRAMPIGVEEIKVGAGFETWQYLHDLK